MQTECDVAEVLTERLEDLAAAHAAFEMAEARLRSVVVDCVEAGVPRAALAEVLRMTPDAVWERFCSPVSVRR